MWRCSMSTYGANWWAEKLRARGVPFVLASAYDHGGGNDSPGRGTDHRQPTDGAVELARSRET